MLKQIDIITNESYQYDFLKVVVWNSFAKAAISVGPISLSLEKLVKLKSSMVGKFSKARLKFKILIVESIAAVTRGVV